MKVKTLFSILLLVFVGISVIVLLGKEAKEPKADSANEGTSDVQKGERPDGGESADAEMLDRKLIVYYFHGDVRCPTCLALEAYSKKVVETKYASELQTGEMEFHVVNFDQSWNKHFISDYDLAFGSLLLVNKLGNEESFTNLERIWELAHDEPGFFEYVQNSIDSALAMR